MKALPEQIQCACLFDQAEEDVCGKCAFMCLVQNDDTVSLQQWIAHGLPQEHTVSHVPEGEQLYALAAMITVCCWLTAASETSRITGRFRLCWPRLLIEEAHLTRVLGPEHSSKRMEYPTSSPSTTSISSATRRATDIAATLRG